MQCAIAFFHSVLVVVQANATRNLSSHINVHTPAGSVANNNNNNNIRLLKN